MWLTATLTILIQLIKDILPEKSRKYIPLMAVLLWIIAVWFLWNWTDYKDMIMQGITIWLSSTWVYQLSKGLLSKENDQKQEISTEDMPILDINLPPED